MADQERGRTSRRDVLAMGGVFAAIGSGVFALDYLFDGHGRAMYEYEVSDVPAFLTDVATDYAADSDGEKYGTVARFAFPLDVDYLDRLPEYGILKPPSGGSYEYRRRHAEYVQDEAPALPFMEKQEPTPHQLTQAHSDPGYGYLEAETGEWQLALYTQNDRRYESGTFRMRRLDHCLYEEGGGGECEHGGLLRS